MPNIPDDIPMMFRAQIQDDNNPEYGCKLENVNNKEHRDKWLKEWVNPQENGKPYIYRNVRGKNGLDGAVYRLFIKFNDRVLTNSGKDSIIRPVWGKNGIPFIPGSSIKGLFLRVCDNENKCYKSVNKQKDITQQEYYCGSQEHSAQLRFHGAYPIGNWTAKTQNGYKILDLIHPQQDKQVKNQDSTSAYPAISLENPTLMFQFSSVDPNINWNEFKDLFYQALSQGLGGKTSIGYGFVDKQKIPEFTKFDDTLVVSLQGEGVTSVTLDGDAEFRPNVFKASLRGHVTRLFAGVSNNEKLVNERVEQLFGSNNSTGLVKLFWQQLRYKAPKEPLHKSIYETSGKLYLYAPESERDLMQKVLQFAYIMGGFGKTWRRVSHHQFYKWYHENKFAIGCHWNCSDPDFIKINSSEGLTQFLEDLYQDCQEYLGINNPDYISSWRESWHPKNVKVYSQVFTDSEVITLFHDDNFKFVPAIGGKIKNDKGETEFVVSHVWHRMLPLDNDQYLEILTLFHGDPEGICFAARQLWQREGNDQLQSFIERLEERGMQLTWGQRFKE